MHLHVAILTAVLGLLTSCTASRHAENAETGALEITRAEPNRAVPDSPCGWIYAFDRRSEGPDLCIYIWPTRTWTVAEETSRGYFGDVVAGGNIEDGIALAFPADLLRDARVLYVAGGVGARLDGRSIPARPGAPHRVLLQVRAGAGGGNPNRIDMNGSTSIYVERFSSEPLSFERAVTMDDESIAHCTDGRLHAGQVFVVTQIAYHGTSVGDSNGHGEFLLVVAGEVVAHSRNSHLPTKGTWRGHIEVPAGTEKDVYVEVANSSTGSAEILGYLVESGGPQG
jgi:hypothetical protein